MRSQQSTYHLLKSYNRFHDNAYLVSIDSFYLHHNGILKKLSKVTSKGILISVYMKGTLNDRKEWCKTVGVDVRKIDEKNEIFFYSDDEQKSKSYNIDDISIIAERIGIFYE